MVEKISDHSGEQQEQRRQKFFMSEFDRGQHGLGNEAKGDLSSVPSFAWQQI